MCTVSFVPLHKDQFILTSNRDETTARGLASIPRLAALKNYELLRPVDPLAHGTWIAASSRGEVICLLNGAFQKHAHRPPYRMSRGQVVLDCFNAQSPESFANGYSLDDIEPFTMVMVNTSPYALHELRWDGNQKFFTRLNTDQYHLWSSATLYRPEIAQAKNSLFERMLREKPSDPDANEMIAIHRRFLYQDWVLPPERVSVVATLSITSVTAFPDTLEMKYLDLVQHDHEPATFLLPKS